MPDRMVAGRNGHSVACTFWISLARRRVASGSPLRFESAALCSHHHRRGEQFRLPATGAWPISTVAILTLTASGVLMAPGPPSGQPSPTPTPSRRGGNVSARAPNHCSDRPGPPKGLGKPSRSRSRWVAQVGERLLPEAHHNSGSYAVAGEGPEPPPQVYDASVRANH